MALEVTNYVNMACLEDTGNVVWASSFTSLNPFKDFTHISLSSVDRLHQVDTVPLGPSCELQSGHKARPGGRQSCWA